MDSGRTLSDSGFSQICNDDNGHIYVTWENDKNGNKNIYFNRSDDYGVTWLANDIRLNDIRLDTDDIPGAHTSLFPQISM